MAKVKKTADCRPCNPQSIVENLVFQDHPNQIALTLDRAFYSVLENDPELDLELRRSLVFHFSCLQQMLSEISTLNEIDHQ